MAEHDIEKIVEAGGEVFNFRDPTKQPVADRVTSWSSTPSDAKYPSEKLVKDSLDGIAGDYRTKDQDISKGANLVVNGSGTMMSNYNFSDCTFVADTDLPVGIAGAFHRSYNTIFPDEFIQLNTEKAFYAEAWYRVKTANKSTVRLSLACYDIDKNAITAVNICYGAGSLTELTQNLNPGDTVVHLADLSNSSWKSETTHHKGFIFWNYVNSLGYTYPPETYSRNVYPESDSSSLWKDSTKVDEVNGTITLKSPWSGPVVPAGTKVSRRGSGSTYYYISSSASAGASTEWTKLSGKFSGFASGGTAIGAFKQGAAFFKLSWINNYTSGDEWIEFAGIELRELPDRIATARKLKTNLARTADSTFDGSADQTNIPVTGTLPVGNGGTGKNSVTSGNYLVGNGSSAMVEKTPKEVGSNVLSSLDDKSNASSYANFVDGDFVVGSDHVDASTISASTFVRRTALNLWNYIKSKLTGSDVNIGGNAATAGTADTAKAYDTSFSGTNSIASKFGEKQNRVAWDIGADTYNASTNRAATVDSIVKRIAVKPDGFSASVDYTNAVELSIPYSAGPGRVALMCVATTGNGDSVSFQATFVKNTNEKLKFVVGTIMASTGTFVSPVLKFLSSDDSSPAQKVVLYIDANVRCNLSCLVAANDGMSSITVTEVARSTADNYSSLQSWGRLANDSGVVHIDGTETIIGAKEFSRSGQDTNFTDSSGAESIVRARTSSNSNNGSAQIDAYAGVGKFGLYARNASGTGKWVACLDNDGVVNLGSSGDAVRIGGTKFVFGASQLGTDSNTFYWV